MRRTTRIVVAGLLATGLFMVLALLPVGPLTRLTSVASAHALLVRSNPQANAKLRAPPQQVTLEFTENINIQASRVVVVDTTNRRVDSNDVRSNNANPNRIVVGLPLIPAGTYVVAYRVQSAADGHVTGGSFIFRIARPDGSVPPIPKVLPTGAIPGGGGTAAPGSATIDGPTVLQALATWLALVALAVWVGGVIWETWVQPLGLPNAAGRIAVAAAAARRFRRLAPYLLGGIVVADVGIVLAQAAALAGEWAGMISLPVLRAVLFGSRFGTFWWLRQGTALAALGLTAVALHRGWRTFRVPDPTTGTGHAMPSEAEYAPDVTPSWSRALLATVRDVPHLPRRLVAGWRALSVVGQLEVLLAACLLVAFGLSGHAAAVPADRFAFALSVDLLHLLANTAWVGGLAYIGFILLPAPRGMDPRTRARTIARGLPAFSAIAIVSAVLLAVTGSLSTTIRLTSIEQFVTTAYGRTLFVKIELFLLMAAISAYHAFVLRPRLATELRHGAQDTSVETLAAASRPAARGSRRAGEVDISVPPATTTPGATGMAAEAETDSVPARIQRLTERLEDWLRREALLGLGVLLCVALLAALAGSLAATPGGSTAASSSSGPIVKTGQAGSYPITFNLSPGAFGTNTFTVTVKDSQGKPLDKAIVRVKTLMLDMDMGEQTIPLDAAGDGSPGVYSGQGDLTMAGNWKVTVIVLPANQSKPVTAEFTFKVGF